MALLVQLFTAAVTASAFSAVPSPPWRGPFQLLHVGPWGLKLDLTLSNFRTPHVLHVDLTTSDSSATAAPTAGPTAPPFGFKSLSSLPPPPPSAVRVVIISDTHGKHSALRLPPSDVLLHCGDVLQRYGYRGSQSGSLSRLNDLDDWFGRQNSEHVLLIGGNHDTFLESKEWRPRNAVLLDGSFHEAAGLIFFGSPYSPPGKTPTDAFQKESVGRDHAMAVLGNTTQKIDLMVTHARCREFEDAASRSRVWAHGHFHDGYGVDVLSNGSKESGRSVLCVNAASCDMIYRPVNPPVVLDLYPTE